MANFSYPKLSEKPDTSKYSVQSEDPAIRSEMEGGYVASRPRFFRKPRRTFKFGYTSLPETDYLKLRDFWDEVMGGSEMFLFVDPFSNEELLVRFKGEQFSGKFVGKEHSKNWDVNGIVLEEV